MGRKEYKKASATTNSPELRIAMQSDQCNSVFISFFKKLCVFYAVKGIAMVVDVKHLRKRAFKKFGSLSRILALSKSILCPVSDTCMAKAEVLTHFFMSLLCSFICRFIFLLLISILAEQLWQPIL